MGNMEPEATIKLEMRAKKRGGAKRIKDHSLTGLLKYPKERAHLAQLAGMAAPGQGLISVGKAPAPMMSMMAKMPGMSGANPMAMMAKMAPLMAKMMAAKGITMPTVE